jgi:DNA modification methylase
VKYLALMNTLYYGDNLEVLRKYIKDDSVDLCYIDPPFNSKRNYNQIYNNVGTEDRAQAQAFVDTWIWDEDAIQGFQEILGNEGNRFPAQTIELIKGLHKVIREGSLLAYLVSMTLRVVEIQRTLKSTGSFYLHCDPTASHYLKLLLDSVFVSQGGDYKNEIVWKRSDAKGDFGQGAQHYGRNTDTLLFYSKGSKITFNPQYTPLAEEYVANFYRHVEEGTGRRYKLDNMLGPGGAAKGNPFYEVMGVSRHWRYSRERMQKLIDEGRVIQTNPGTVPMFKRYLDESLGVPVGNLWNDISLIRGHSKEKLGYPTQKPEGLLERIIGVSSNEGDVVLDAYCGCGTTITVAQRLKRQWVGIDITYQSIALMLRRLEATFGKAALQTITLNGIPQDMESAKALANKADDRVRKEFEKWAVLTYTSNRAIINDKKGADAGIDGIAYFKTAADDNAKVVFQVKSGNVGRGDIAKLSGDMMREGAAMAAFVTLQEPTAPMRAEAKSAGTYYHPLMQRNYDKIQIVTIKEIIEDEKRLDLPMSLEVLKAAQLKVKGDQLDLLMD